MLLDMLFKFGPTILAILLTFTAWREYKQLAEPDTRAIFGLIAMIFFSILSIIGCILYLINPIKFKYNPFLLCWVLAYCTNWLTARKYTMNPNHFRTGAAITGFVLVIIGTVVEFMNI